MHGILLTLSLYFFLHTLAFICACASEIKPATHEAYNYTASSLQ